MAVRGVLLTVPDADWAATLAAADAAEGFPTRSDRCIVDIEVLITIPTFSNPYPTFTKISDIFRHHLYPKPLPLVFLFLKNNRSRSQFARVQIQKAAEGRRLLLQFGNLAGKFMELVTYDVTYLFIRRGRVVPW